MPGVVDQKILGRAAMRPVMGLILHIAHLLTQLVNHLPLERRTISDTLTHFGLLFCQPK